MTALRSLELKIPPPAVALVVAVAMWAASRGATATVVPEFLRVPVAVAIGLAGAAFDLSGVVAFLRAHTTLNPLRPQAASTLVDVGVYRWTRNPMYVGLALILCGWAVFLGSWWALPGPLVFAAYIGRFQIAPEERALAARFGDAYRAYQARVRRWL
jgi:protein-S-isoprenylcysteine O-methyltransferase Ste14